MMIESVTFNTTTATQLSRNLKGIADEMPLRTIPLIEYVELVYVGSEGSPARFPPSTCPPSDPSKGPLDQQPV